MKTLLAFLSLILMINVGRANNACPTEDTFKTANGQFTITFIGHASLMITNGDGFNIHVDPFTKVGDYSKFKAADLVLITHGHFDHLDKAALEKIKKPDTTFIVNQAAAASLSEAAILANGQKTEVGKITIEAVPAYNIVHKRDNDQPYHPIGEGNGYVITIDDKRIYIAGDTENIPEMANLGEIDIAFLPMNLPYTMTPEMTADAAKMVKPKILYPYHTSETNTQKVVDLLKDSAIEVRIREMK